MAPRKPKARKCPICGRAPVDAFKPFCSRRCVDADLAKWLGGSYAIPGAPVSEEALEDAEPPPSRKPQ